MDFESLEKIWEKQTVAGAPIDADRLLRELKQDVANAERRIRGGLVIVTALLILEWTVALGAHFVGLKTLTALQGVAHLTVSALYVAFLIRARQARCLVEREGDAQGRTLRASTMASLQVVEMQIGHVHLAAGGIPLAVGACTWLFLAKWLAGSMPDIGAAISIGFVVVVGAAIGAAVWRRYRAHLVPRQAQLRETLRALETEAES